MIKVEIDEKKLEEYIEHFLQENIESIAYKISMKEITEMIREEVDKAFQQYINELQKKKKFKFLRR